MATPPPISPVSESSPTSLRFNLPLLAILILALVLRLWGIRWGLPNAERYFSFHPDESDVVTASLRAVVLFDPGFYNYGALPLFLNGVAILTGSALGLASDGSQAGIPGPGAFLAARLVTVALGVGTCAFLYNTGRLLYGRASGILAAALYAVAPLAVQHGHFATVDVPATFFITGSLFFAARAASSERKPRDLFWAGIFAGLAAASKYNAGLVVLAGVWAWRQGAYAPKSLAAVLGGALLGFVVGCPPIYTNPAGLFGAIAFESRHVATGHGDVFTNTAPGIVYHIYPNLFWALGWPVTLASLVAVGYAIYRRRKGDALLAAFALPYFILICLAQVKFARYTLPLFPPLLLLVGSLIPPSSHRAFRPVTLSLGLAGAFALLLACGFDTTMSGTDPRDQAAAFIRQSGASSVGFATGPWFFSPPLAPGLSSPRPKSAQIAALNSLSPRLIPSARISEEVLEDGTTRPQVNAVEWNSSLLQETAPDMVTLSEYEYADTLRIRRPETVSYMEALRRTYPNQRVFANPVQVGGLSLVNNTLRDGLPVQTLPHDMTYTNPQTVVFSK